MLRLMALGRSSKLMLAKEPGNIQVIRPLKEGVIADFDKTIWMLNGFMKRVKENAGWFRTRIVISLPCKGTFPEKDAQRFTRPWKTRLFLRE